MAEPDLPQVLEAQLLDFMMDAPDVAVAFGAVLGVVAGACIERAGARATAEALWDCGDRTVERAGGHG